MVTSISELPLSGDAGLTPSSVVATIHERPSLSFHGKRAEGMINFDPFSTVVLNLVSGAMIVFPL